MAARLTILALISASFATRADGFRQISTETPERQADETLVEGKTEHGGYGGPRVAYGRIAGHDAVQVGAEGGWIVNRRFILGGAGYGLATNQPAPGTWAATDNLTFGYGGALIGYTLLPEKLVHATFTALVGAGGLGTRALGSNAATDLADSFFVFEPAATIDVNVARHFRLGVAVSYRWVSGVETTGITNSEMSGVFGSMILKFGKF
jgi:hypothetical protein